MITYTKHHVIVLNVTTRVKDRLSVIFVVRHIFLKVNRIYPFKANTCERSFKCYICGKAYFRKGQLNRHLLTHLPVKLFRCTKCGKFFSYKTSLQRHIRKNRCKI
ncbi:hypothetical protein Avbf_12413 [Armadillidium vulgare]|nr:hypothetical protein Avbf_12413 [Armadillidium vulgare]